MNESDDVAERELEIQKRMRELRQEQQRREAFRSEAEKRAAQGQGLPWIVEPSTLDKAGEPRKPRKLRDLGGDSSSAPLCSVCRSRHPLPECSDEPVPAEQKPNDTISALEARVKQLEEERDRALELVAQKEPEISSPSLDVEHETTLCLDKAKEIVLGDRARDYGRPSDNHTMTADLWDLYMIRRRESQGPHYRLDSFDVCMLNMLQKISRLAWRRIEDGTTDLAGYAQNARWCQDSL